MKRAPPTPGPWETDKGSVHGWTVPGELQVICEGATEANAKLIASAPALLAALNWAWAQLEAMRDHVPSDSLRSYELGVEQARAAIAKAGGSR